jgi:Beta-propeller repeat
MHRRLFSRAVAAFGVLLACGPGVAQGGSESRPGLNPNSRFRIEWATFLGGEGADEIKRVLVAPDGSVWVCGQAGSPGLPVSPEAVKPTYSEPLRKRNNIGGDGYVAHFASDGRFLAGTYFGGEKQDEATGVALDHHGFVVLFGATMSSDLPTTEGVIQPKHAEFRPPAPGEGWKTEQDWFVAKLTPDLKRVGWCTYLGGPGCESPGRDVLVDGDDTIIVAGEVHRSFPHAVGDSRPMAKHDPSDACVAKIRADGTGLISCCRFGGQGSDKLSCLGLLANGSIVVAGTSGGNVDGTGTPDFHFPSCIRLGADYWIGTFRASLTADGSELATLLFVNGEATAHGGAVAADGSVVLGGGGITGTAFPFTEGAYERTTLGKQDASVLRVAPDGKSLAFCTGLGGAENENLRAVALSGTGNVWVAGTTSSEGMKITGDALHFYRGGACDGLLACLSADGARLLFATYLGGTSVDAISDVAVTPDGSIYVVGMTTSADFPVTGGALQKTIGGSMDGFVLKLRENPRPIDGR